MCSSVLQTLLDFPKTTTNILYYYNLFTKHIQFKQFLYTPKTCLYSDQQQLVQPDAIVDNYNIEYLCDIFYLSSDTKRCRPYTLYIFSLLYFMFVQRLYTCCFPALHYSIKTMYLYV